MFLVRDEIHSGDSEPGVISRVEMESDEQKAGIEVSVVMPCLNKRDTIGRCIDEVSGLWRELSVQGKLW